MEESEVTSGFNFRGAHEGWIEVDGDDLPGLIKVKTRLIDHRLRIVGLTIDDEDRPITSATLKRIPLGRLSSELHAFVREMLSELADPTVDDLLALPSHQQVEAYFAGAAKLTGAEEAAVELAHEGAARHSLEQLLLPPAWTEDSDDSADALTNRGRGANPPTIDELRRFARVYLEELSNGRGAVVRTGRRTHMHRSTVNRWIRLCQEHKLVPNGDR